MKLIQRESYMEKLINVVGTLAICNLAISFAALLYEIKGHKNNRP